MSDWSTIPVRDLVASVHTWNPLREHYDDVFDYIDLSAIDQAAKLIIGMREVTCGEAPSRARQLVATNDVLISTVRPNLNGIAKVNPEQDGATASTGFCVLRPRPNLLLSSYLFHWVKSPQFVADMVSKATGASYPAVSDRIIFDSPIPAPPLPEQRRIAAILDQADALRVKRREALAQLDSLTQSIFIEMFGDPVTNSKLLPTKPLNQLTTFENGDRSGNYPSGDDIKEVGVLFLSTKNITDGRLDLTKSVYITEEKFDSLSRGKIKRNDLVITLRGTLGSCCIFDTVHETAFINAQMMIIRPGLQCNSTYLHALLTSQQAQERFNHIGRGAAVPQLTSAQMASLQIPVPSLADQQEFELRKNSMDELKGRQERSLTELNTLFASLQHRAFRGEL